MNIALVARFKNWLETPIDQSSLAVFRFLFGLLMVIEQCRYFSIAAYQYHGGFHFTYPFLGFVRPPSSNPDWNAAIVESLFVVMIIAAGLVMIGCLYRVAIISFFLIYTYFFLTDLTFYNNHFYLISLLSFLMCFLDLSGSLSFDAWWKQKSKHQVPFWQLGILRLQWCIVYFYAGLAKLQPDWLGGEPVRGIFLERNERIEMVVNFFGVQNLTYIIAWGGAAFDLLIPVCLLSKRTRYFTLPAFVIFHSSNHFMFDIGIFPWLALASIVLFFQPDWPRELFNWLFSPVSNKKKKKVEVETFQLRPLLFCLLSVYFAIQIALPLRHYFYPQRSGWTQQGYKFAWRMMLNHWDSWLRITVFDAETKQSFLWNRHHGITQVQWKGMRYQPRALAQYAKYVRDEAKKLGIKNPQIQIEAVVSLNGRPHQFLVNPNVDASQLTWDDIENGDWVIPLQNEAEIGDYADSESDRLKRVASAKRPTPESN